MANLYMILNVIYNVCTERAKQRTDKGTNAKVQKRTYIFLYICAMYTSTAIPRLTSDPAN
jgi:hypothetical protein